MNDSLGDLGRQPVVSWDFPAQPFSAFGVGEHLDPARAQCWQALAVRLVPDNRDELASVQLVVHLGAARERHLEALGELEPVAAFARHG